MKNIGIVLLLFLSACTNSNNPAVVNNQSLQVQGDAGIGEVEYGKVGSKTLLFTNNESGTLNLTPSLSGANGSDFGLVQLNCTSVLPGRSCKVVVTFQSVGKLAGSYEASLTVGSQVLPVSASIASIPDPVVEIKVNGVVVNGSLDLGTISPRSARLLTVTVANKGPIMATGTITASNQLFNKVYSGCDNISLKPNQSCTAKLYVQGQMAEGILSTDLSFGDYVTNLSLENLADTTQSNIQPISASLDLGDITSSGERVIKVITLTNNGDGVGGLNNLLLPPGYTYLHDNCGSLKPKQKCTLRVLYESDSVKGLQSGDITFNDSSVTSVVNRVDVIENLSSITVSSLPVEAVVNSCQPITISFKDAQNVGFILSQNLIFSLSLDFYNDSNCSQVKAKELTSFTHEVFGFVKMPGSQQNLSVVASVNSVSGQENIQIYSLLDAQVVNSNLMVGQTTNLIIVGGKTPYIIEKNNNNVSLNGFQITGEVAGSSTITVSDQLGQIQVLNLSVAPQLVLTAGSCSFAVPESVDCTVSVSGGVGTVSFDADQGTISNSGVFKGQCVNNLGSSVVTVTDEANNSVQVNLSYPCVYKSCNQIKADVEGAVSGIYWIDLDELSSGSDPFKVYCNQELAQGGWTLVANIATTTTGYTTTSSSALIGENPNFATNYNLYQLFPTFNSTNKMVTINGTTQIPGMLVPTPAQSRWVSDTLGSAPAYYPYIDFITSPGYIYGFGFSQNQVGQPNVGRVTWCSATEGLYLYFNADGQHPGVAAWQAGCNSTLYWKNNFSWQLYDKMAYYKLPTSCLDAKQKGVLNKSGTTGSGIYTLDLDGFGVGGAPFDAYCDQETDTGGWQLVASGWIPAYAASESPDMITMGQFIYANGDVRTPAFKEMRHYCRRNNGSVIHRKRTYSTTNTTKDLHIFNGNAFSGTDTLLSGHNTNVSSNWNQNGTYTELHFYHGDSNRFIIRNNSVHCGVNYSNVGGENNNPVLGQEGMIFVR